MRKPLSVGTEIQLYEIGSSKATSFTITEMVGMGASCIVYTAVHVDAEGNAFSVRLKEFLPMEMDITRDGTNLIVSEGYKAEFSEMLSCFTSGYQKQLELRQNLEQMNSISNIQSIFTGNNTKYIAMSCNSGGCLTTEQNYSFMDILRIVSAVAKQIAGFHKNGYLYLDLKPNNIFLYPETFDMVMLFDFDSVIRKEDAVQHTDWLSFTVEWSAPELCKKQSGKIDERADVYSIGALLLFLLFRRKPNISDRRRFSDWNEEMQHSVLATESPETKRVVTEVLRKTLASGIEGRFRNCEELLAVIEPYLAKLQNPRPYLKTHLPSGNHFFCGRDLEMQKIHEMLQEESIMVLHGIGGIGKTELAKHYAEMYLDSYDAVIFVRYIEDFETSILMDSNFPVVHFHREDNESDDAYFERKIKVLQEICTPRHLLIIDNFDEEECDFFDVLTSLACKILMTSRTDYSDTFAQLDLDILSEYDDLYSIAKYYYKEELTSEDSQYMEKIIVALSGHTMAIELIAKQMYTMKLTPSKMYEKLTEAGVSANEGKVRNLKDGKLKSRTAYAHIETLFSILHLNEEEKQILKYIALVGPNPMLLDYFKEICELTEPQEDILSKLIRSGWIQEEFVEELHILVLHTLISEVLCKQLQPDSESCCTFVLNAACIAAGIDEIGEADERKANIRWLDHMAHHISGENSELTFFFSKMTYPVYLGEEDYQKALWSAKRELDLLEKADDNENQIVSALFFARAIADRLHDEQEFQKFDAMLQDRNLTEEDHIRILSADLLEHVANHDIDSARTAVEQIISISEMIGSDRVIASAYSIAVWFENAFQSGGVDKGHYAKLAINRMERFAAEHLQDFEEDSKELADFWSDMGDAYRDYEDYEQAIEYYQKYTAIMLELQQGESSYLVQNTMQIAVCYQKMEDYEHTIENYEKALAYAEKFYGKEHPETCDIMRTYAFALIEMFNATENTELLLRCRGLMEAAIEMLSESDGISGVNLADLYLKYSSVLSQLGEFEKSHYFATMAYDFFKEFYGELDERMVWVYLIIGDNYLKEKNKINAEKYYHLAEQIFEANDWNAKELKEVITNVLKNL